MKRISLFLALIFVVLNSFAQAPPEKMSYQAVVRDGSNNVVSSSVVGMQISILQGSVSGTAVYIETQTPTSNINGLVSLEIGAGTVQSGSFSEIDWTNGPYFIKTETDPSGGASYTITGISQLLSVPYALHAKTADSISGPINETDPIFEASAASGILDSDITEWNADNDPTNELQQLSVSATGDTLYLQNGGFVIIPGISDANTQIINIGDIVDDGIVGYIFQPGDSGYVAGETHGIIAALNDLPNQYIWGSNTVLLQNEAASQYLSSLSDEIGMGKVNTDTILSVSAQTGILFPAAEAASNYDNGMDWFLPSSGDLVALKNSLASQDLGDFVTVPVDGNNLTTVYWSSSIMANFVGALGPFFAPGASVCGCAYFGANYVRPVKYF